MSLRLAGSRPLLHHPDAPWSFRSAYLRATNRQSPAACRNLKLTPGRVEDGRGGLRLCQSLRFPSPLIKPDVRVSRIRLSDWFRCEAHDGNPAAARREPRRSFCGGISASHDWEPYAADDVLMVTRLDRLARSTRDLLNTLDAIAGKSAGFRSLGDVWADTTTPHGR